MSPLLFCFGITVTEPDFARGIARFDRQPFYRPDLHCGACVCQGMIDLSLGQLPQGILNPEVAEKESFQEKWKRLQLI